MCAFFVAAPGGAAVIEKLKFKDALELAFNHNLKMIEEREAVESAQGDLITARTLKNPEVEFESEGDLEIKQPFDPIGVRFLKSKIASNQIKIHSEALRQTWSIVYQHVRDTYSSIIFNEKRLELAEDNLKVMRQFFARVQQRYQSGQVFKNDFQRAKIELLQAEHEYLTVHKELTVKRARLNLILGRPIETEFEISEKFKEERLLSSIDDLKTMAMANRPDIAMAELELDSKQKDAVKEQFARLPAYSVGVRRMDDEDDYVIVVGISLPFWNLNQGEVKKAKAARKAQSAKMQAVKHEAMFDVYQSFLDVELAQKQFELSKKSMEESIELFRLANLRYSEGKIDFLNYIDQIKAATQAKVKYYEGLFELSRTMSALEVSIYTSLRQEEFFNEKF